MEEDNYKGDLRSAAVGAGLGAFFSGISVGAIVGGAVGAGLGATAFGAIVGGVGGKGKNFVIGGLTSLLVYSAMTFASVTGYNRGVETRLTPFSVGEDQGVVVRRGDDSERPYVFRDGKYVLFDDESKKSLDSKVKEDQEGVDGLKRAYENKRNAILESIRDTPK